VLIAEVEGGILVAFLLAALIFWLCQFFKLQVSVQRREPEQVPMRRRKFRSPEREKRSSTASIGSRASRKEKTHTAVSFESDYDDIPPPELDSSE
jgi:hypothetical protein